MAGARFDLGWNRLRPAPPEDGDPSPAWPAFERRALVEIARRGNRGTWVHLSLWLALGLSAGAMDSAPAFFWGNAAVFFGVACGRTFLWRRVAAWVEHRPDFARRAIAAAILGVALHWGIVSLFVLVGPIEALRATLPIVLVGVAATATMVLALDPLVRRIYAWLVLAPGLGWTFLHPGTADLFTAVGTVVMALYIQLASRQVHDDYWSAAIARDEIERRARELDRLSRTDELTQLHNRRAFDERLAIAWAAAARQARCVAVLLVDLDHFKRINDRHGHPFGDRCLRAAADALATALLRPADVLARHGGEEFAVLLPETDVAGALAVAERMRERVAQIDLAPHGSTLPLRCSIGVCVQLAVAGVDPATLLGRADRALYKAKETGRNRVALWEPETAVAEAVAEAA